MKSRVGRVGFTNWEELRNHAIQEFGETPHPAVEQEIIDAYELHPDQVARAIENVAHDVKNGTVRSGWGVLKKRAAVIRTPPSNPSAGTSKDREKAISRAEQWIHAAGIHFDRASEVQDELFGDRGLLHAYRHDLQLVDRLLDLWEEQRPIGEELEADALQRAEDWKRQQAEMRAKLAAKQAELEAQAEIPEPEYALVGETPPPDETTYQPNEDP